MRIGTAVPSTEELSQATHHFIQHKSITEDYNVGMFERDAVELLDDLFKVYDVVIMVGGSGLYVKAVAEGLDDFPEVHSSIRETLNARLENEGLEALQTQLRILDHISYETIAIDNPHRVIRALEICIGAGQPYSSYLNKKAIERPFKTISVGLMADREIIYNRINRRVDLMLENGLLNEARSLLSHQHLNALNTVGYKEFFNYLNKDWTLDFAISEIKKNTRRFAKRQLTWFKKQENISWFDYKVDNNLVFKTIEQHFY